MDIFEMYLGNTIKRIYFMDYIQDVRLHLLIFAKSNWQMVAPLTEMVKLRWYVREIESSVMETLNSRCHIIQLSNVLFLLLNFKIITFIIMF